MVLSASQNFVTKLQKGGFDSLDSMLAALSLIEACGDSTAQEAGMAAYATANSKLSVSPCPAYVPCCSS